jgi:hypothetical protein
MHVSQSVSMAFHKMLQKLKLANKYDLHYVCPVVSADRSISTRRLHVCELINMALLMLEPLPATGYTLISLA